MERKRGKSGSFLGSCETVNGLATLIVHKHLKQAVQKYSISQEHKQDRETKTLKSNPLLTLNREESLSRTMLLPCSYFTIQLLEGHNTCGFFNSGETIRLRPLFKEQFSFLEHRPVKKMVYLTQIAPVVIDKMFKNLFLFPFPSKHCYKVMHSSQVSRYSLLFSEKTMVTKSTPPTVLSTLQTSNSHTQCSIAAYHLKHVSLADLLYHIPDSKFGMPDDGSLSATSTVTVCQRIVRWSNGGPLMAATLIV